MVKIDLKLPDFAKRFKAKQNEIMLVLAATMQTNRAMMFDKDGGDNGKPVWAPLKIRQGRPLQDTGTLRKSFGLATNGGKTPGRSPDGILQIAGQKAVIGTKIFYASVQNDGTAKMPNGVISAKNARALKIPLGGGKFMFRHSVTIPARRMDEITKEDENEFAETLANYIAEAVMSG